MHNMSMVQVLSVWMELEDALHGENGYGGDTAEIYIYRLMAYQPGAGRCSIEEEMQSPIRGPGVVAAYDAANVSLHNILVHFAKEREAQIEVDGNELGEWLKTARNTHRVHVRVIDLRAG